MKARVKNERNFFRLLCYSLVERTLFLDFWIDLTRRKGTYFQLVEVNMKWSSRLLVSLQGNRFSFLGILKFLFIEKIPSWGDFSMLIVCGIIKAYREQNLRRIYITELYLWTMCFMQISLPWSKMCANPGWFTLAAHLGIHLKSSNRLPACQMFSFCISLRWITYLKSIKNKKKETCYMIFIFEHNESIKIAA